MDDRRRASRLPGQALLRTARAFEAELHKMFAQRSTYAGFVVIALVVVLVVYGIWRHGPEVNEAGRLAGSQMVVAGKTLTAPLVLQFILPAVMEVLMALLVAAIGGGLIAAEVRSGTIRTLLMRPVTRLELLAAKLAAGWVYTLALCAFTALAAAALGYVVFGPGDLVSVITGKIVIFSHEQALSRLGLAYLLAAVGRCVIMTVAVMLSCLFDNALTAAAVTVAALLGFSILEQIPYFHAWRPYFLTTYLSVYRLPLEASIGWLTIGHDLLGLAAYTVAGAVVAAVAFGRRDITT